MANYSTHAAVSFPVASADGVAFAENLYSSQKWEFSAEFVAEGNENLIYINSERGGFVVERAVEFIQAVLQHEKSPAIVFLEWSNLCDKARPNGFGGGAVAVSADDTSWMATADPGIRLKLVGAIETRRKIAEIMAVGGLGEDLDDVVHDYKSEEASDINNSNVESQLEYILTSRSGTI